LLSSAANEEQKEEGKEELNEFEIVLDITQHISIDENVTDPHDVIGDTEEAALEHDSSRRIVLTLDIP